MRQRQRNLGILFSALLFSGCASAAPTQDGLSDGDAGFEIQHGGRTRSYSVHMPAGASSKPLPLVVSLHGGGGNARVSALMTGFNDEADRSKFIVVHPNGTGQARPLLNALGRGFLLSWNAGTCCSYAKENNVDDVGFIRAVVAEVKKKYPVDAKRIYASGISNGGMMSYRLACEASDVFAAIGVVSGALTYANCKPTQPVSVIHIHGTADQNVPLLGGVGSKSYDRDPKPPVQDAINFWLRADGISAKAQTSTSGNVRKDVYKGANGVDVVFYLLTGGGHSWPGGQRILATLDAPSPDLNATRTLWEFFATHARP